MASRPPPVVLIVDDVQATRTGLAELLRLKGYEALEAADGHQALKMLRADPRVSVVVLDMNIPRGDGRWCRQQPLTDPAIARILVILFTGATEMPEDSLLFDERLRKPLAVGALLQAVRRYAN